MDHTATMSRQRFILFAVVLALAALWGAGRSVADQTDQRLKDLFAQLRVARSAEVARPVEARIWAIWTEAGNPAADRLMIAGLVAMRAGQYHLALDTFGRLVEIAPDFAEGWNKRATVLFLVGRYADRCGILPKFSLSSPDISGRYQAWRCAKSNWGRMQRRCKRWNARPRSTRACRG